MAETAIIASISRRARRSARQLVPRHVAIFARSGDCETAKTPLAVWGLGGNLNMTALPSRQ
jgi:hypothetical protein